MSCFQCHHDVAICLVSDAIMMLQHVLLLPCSTWLALTPKWRPHARSFFVMWDAQQTTWSLFAHAVRWLHWSNEVLTRDRFLWCEMHNKQHNPCLPMQYVGCTDRVKSSREIVFCDVRCTTNNMIPVCPCSTLAALIEWSPHARSCFVMWNAQQTTQSLFAHAVRWLHWSSEGQAPRSAPCQHPRTQQRALTSKTECQNTRRKYYMNSTHSNKLTTGSTTHYIREKSVLLPGTREFWRVCIVVVWLEFPSSHGSLIEAVAAVGGPDWARAVV